MTKTTNITREKLLADSIPTAIIALDNKANILWWNKAAQNLFAQRTTLPSNLEALLDTTYYFKYLSDQKQKPLELELPNRPDEQISISFVPYTKGKHLLLGQNITHLHHLEVMRQDFVANVSHELRTPLTVIHGYLETLLNQKITDSKILENIFSQMFQQSIRMERLVTDLLLLSRLETESPTNEKGKIVNIATLLKNICHEAKILSGAKQHHIYHELDEKLSIYGVEDELRSAFSNIIFNAVHYTPAGGKIYVKWFKQASEPHLEVTDTGIGIAPEHISRITERFYRVDKDRSRASGGTGLGLAIVKHALLRHNGHLTIMSTLGKGSTFSCIFSKESIVS